MKLNMLIGLFVVVTLFSLSFASADMFENFSIQGTGTAGFDNTNWRAMTWTVGNVSLNTAFRVDSIALALCNSQAANSTMIAGIRATNSSGNPIGEDLTNGTLSTSSLLYCGDAVQPISWINITMSSGSLTVNPSTKYAIVMRTASAGAAVSWNASSTGNYPGGNLVIGASSGATWVPNVNDAFFAIYGTSSGLSNITESQQSVIYQTQQNISTNITYNIPPNNITSGYYWWNGTRYAATLTNLSANTSRLSYLLSPGTFLGNATSFWEILLDGINIYNSSSVVQTVNPIVLGNCNSTLNTAYFNFTFIDESTLTAINGTIDSSFSYYLNGGDSSSPNSLNYLNSSVNNPNYGFCFSPSHLTASISGTIAAGNPLYASRTYTINGNYTNSSTSIPLYLLSSSSGITTSIQTSTLANQPISGVSVTVERQISNVWVTVGQGTSDGSGLVTFFLNPSYSHRVTGSKAGYSNSQVTLIPSQSVYTLIMTNTNGTIAAYNSSIAGMRWIIYPSTGRITNMTAAQVYGMNLTASYGNLYGCMAELVDNGTTLASAVQTGDYSCNVSLSYNIPTSSRIYGRFSINNTLTNGVFMYIDTDALWYKIESNTTAWSSVTAFFSEMNGLKEFGSDIDHREYTKIVLFFIVLTILMGILSYFTQYDTIYPGFAFVIVWILIFAASTGGWFTLNFGNATNQGFLASGGWFAQYWVLMVSTLYLIGYLANYWARRSMQ